MRSYMESGIEYSKGIKVLMFIIRFFGSLFITLALFLFFITLFGTHLIENADDLSMIAPVAADKFFEDYKREIREMAVEQSGGQIPPAPQIRQACVEAPQMVPGGICSNIGSMTDLEVQNAVIDASIYEELMAGFLSPEASKQFAQTFVQGAGIKEFLDFKTVIMIAILALFVIGVFLIFITYKFKPLISLYKVCTSCMTTCLLVSAAFFFLNTLSPDTVAGMFDNMGDMLLGASAGEVPLVVIKLFAAVFLEWISVSAGYVLIFSISSFVIFLAGVIGIRVYNYVKKTKAPTVKQANAEDVKKEAVPEDLKAKVPKKV